MNHYKISKYFIILAIIGSAQGTVAATCDGKEDFALASLRLRASRLTTNGYEATFDFRRIASGVRLKIKTLEKNVGGAYFVDHSSVIVQYRSPSGSWLPVETISPPGEYFPSAKPGTLDLGSIAAVALNMRLLTESQATSGAFFIEYYCKPKGENTVSLRKNSVLK